MTTQISIREDFCRRVLELPDEGFFQIKQYLDDILPHILSSHIPNAETQEAIAELLAGKGKRFSSIEDLIADLHDGWRKT